MACGGHGYNGFAGFLEILNNILPMQTYEGENTILHL
jgi:hypothetical protein